MDAQGLPAVSPEVSVRSERHVLVYPTAKRPLIVVRSNTFCSCHPIAQSIPRVRAEGRKKVLLDLGFIVLSAVVLRLNG
jgi:hypothetical protein